MSSTCKSIIKRFVVCSFIATISCFMIFQAVAAPQDDDSLLRVEVKVEDGEQVSVSVPLSLIRTMYKVMPKEIQRVCKELKLTPEILLAELGTLEGEDLVRITGKENVRVWVEKVTTENKKDLNFVRVKVLENKENGHEVTVCVPRGLVQLTGEVITSLGLVDKYVELPKEIRELKVDRKVDTEEF
jgi:hypothetical protein